MGHQVPPTSSCSHHSAPQSASDAATPTHTVRVSPSDCTCRTSPAGGRLHLARRIPKQLCTWHHHHRQARGESGTAPTTTPNTPTTTYQQPFSQAQHVHRRPQLGPPDPCPPASDLDTPARSLSRRCLWEGVISTHGRERQHHGGCTECLGRLGHEQHALVIRLGGDPAVVSAVLRTHLRDHAPPPSLCNSPCTYTTFRPVASS